MDPRDSCCLLCKKNMRDINLQILKCAVVLTLDCSEHHVNHVCAVSGPDPLPRLPACLPSSLFAAGPDLLPGLPLLCGVPGGVQRGAVSLGRVVIPKQQIRPCLVRQAGKARQASSQVW